MISNSQRIGRYWALYQEDLILAKNSNTSPFMLNLLADLEDSKIREEVAKNPNTSIKTLRRLLGDERSFIRDMARGNPNLDNATKFVLAYVQRIPYCTVDLRQLFREELQYLTSWEEEQ